VGFALFIHSEFALGADKPKVTYDDQIAPIFRQRCSTCHSPTTKKSDLDVTTYSSLMHGGSSGPVVEVGDPDSSRLFQLVARKSEPFMPQNADKLPDSELDVIRHWIKSGALENAGSKAAAPKPIKTIAAESVPGKRPDLIPMPPRMVLEPAFRVSKTPMARSLATSPWAPLVAVASQRQVLLYNTKTLDLVGVYPFPEGQPNVVRFSRDGRLLLAGGGRPAASGRVVVWDITTGQRIAEVGKELDVVLAADISADHKHIALGGPERIVKIYSTESGALEHQMAKHTDWVTALEFSPDGVLLATADRNGGLCVWETDSGHEYLTLTGHTAAVNAVSWRGDSNALASASEDATIRLWEMENGTAVKNWNAKSPLLSIAFTRDGRLATSGRDGVSRIWNQDGKQLLQTKPIGELAVSTTYCSESHRAITASLAGMVQVYDDKSQPIGNLATNPPPLEERLAAATKALQQKTLLTAPLEDAKREAEATVTAARAALSTEQQKLAASRTHVDMLAAEIKQLTATRAASDAERTKAAASLQQIDSARPSVAEALRYLTEALGKLPSDAKLASAQHGLNEQLKKMESHSASLRKKIADLSAEVASADTKLKDANSNFDAANNEVSAGGVRVKSIKAELKKFAAAFEAAKKSAALAEKELAAANQAVAHWQAEIAFRNKIAELQKQLEAAHKLAAERQADVDKANLQLTTAQSAAKTASAKRDEALRGIDSVMTKIQQARSAK
jgi:WD40 repeat protein